MASKAPTAARSRVVTNCTASAGRPASAIPSASPSAMTRLECSASEPPRKIAALPDFKHRLAASAVTFGRDS